MCRKLHEYVTVSPVSARFAVSVQVAVSEFHSARETKWLNLMCGAIPNSCTVARRYFMIDGPSAIALASVHGLKL